MRRTAVLAILVSCCLATSAVAQIENLSNTRTLPPKGFGGVPQGGPLVGGDTFGTATVIPGLPYSDGGNTCAFNNDYGAGLCPPSTAPDVVYRFTPSANVCVNVSLCNSSYDTELAIYRNNPATQIACQDDSPECGLLSFIGNVPLTAGETYYFVISGFSTACGPYVLDITECPLPPVCQPCPAGALQEGEVTCFDGYIDNYNGGCNSNPVVVTTLPPVDVTVCGTYGNFNARGTRDTDWYQFVVPPGDPCNIRVTVNGAGLTGSALAIVDALCPPTIICGQFAPSQQCGTVVCAVTLPPGTYRIFTASFFDGTPCGSRYVLTLDYDCPTDTQASTWGQLKTRYR